MSRDWHLYLEDAIRFAEHIPWQKIIATRNILAHAYFGIDHDILWDIVSNQITDLLPKLRNIQ